MRTARWVRLLWGQCVMRTTIALARKASEITEAHCPNSRRRNSRSSDFYPLFCRPSTESPECLGQCSNEVGGHQRLLASAFVCDVAREAVQIHRRQNRDESALRILRDHSSNHASENVASSPSRHARISRGVYPRLAVRTGNYGAVALQDQN